jgi:hypothetical protein
VSLVGTASADQIDIHTKQLDRGRDYKLRLSAAVSLGKAQDPRAVRALTRALQRDKESTVRRIAAQSLGKIVTRSTPRKLIEDAVSALERAAKRDKDKKVRRSAKRTLTKLSPLAKASDDMVFINVGKPADRTRKAPRDLPDAIDGTVRQTLQKRAPDYSLDWPTGKLPTGAELERERAQGYFVGATVAKLDVQKRGRTAEIRCAVQIRVNPWAGRDRKERWEAKKAAQATGNGKVTGPNSQRGIHDSMRDCVLAVVEQVTTRQVVPFLRRLAKNP